MNRFSMLEKQLKISSIIFKIFVVVFLLKFLEAFYPFMHGDPLNYHLVWPRLVIETSFSEMVNDFFPFFQSGYFDILYFIPNLIFGNHLGTQILGQVIHQTLSLGITSILFYFLFDKSILGMLAAIAVLTLSNSSDFFLYAKSDGFLAFMTLVTALLALESRFEDKKWHPYLVGFLLGFLPGIKMNGLLMSLAIGLFYFWKNRKKFDALIKVILLAILSISPKIFLNWYYLKSPLFPGFLGLFPGVLDPYLIKTFNELMNNPINLNTFLWQLSVFFKAKIFFLILPFLIYFNFKFKKKNSLIIWNSILIFILYLGLNGGVKAARFIFPCMFLNTYFIFKSLESYTLKNRHYVLILLVLLIDSKLDKSVVRIVDYSKSYLTLSENEILLKYNYLNNMWKFIDTKNRVKTFIFSDNFGQMFYSPQGVRIFHYPTHPQTIFFHDCKNSDEMKNYQYAIFSSQFFNNKCYEFVINNGKLVTIFREYKLYEIPQK